MPCVYYEYMKIGHDESCELCGQTYGELKTGLTFSDVRGMLWSGNPDPSTWKNKGRHTVLGLWHQIKVSMWKEHQEMCEMQAAYYESIPTADLPAPCPF